MKFFKRHTTTTPETTPEKPDIVVCKVKVFNPAIAHPISETDFKKSELHLLNEFRSHCHSAGYRIEIISY